MRIELRVLNNGSNGKPIEVFVNQVKGDLYINRRRVYLEGYLNITGPHKEDEGENTTIRITYRIKDKKKIDQSIFRLKGMVNSEIQIYKTELMSGIVDLIFPQGSRVAVGNYNPYNDTYHVS